MGNKFDQVKCGAMLRQSQSRINIHRSKKLTGIAKKKDDICRHLESGNEVNAKIWCETLINEENMIPVYDVVSTMCNQVEGRLTQIKKFGAPKDMNTTFATIIHSARKLDVKELITVRSQLSAILAPEFVRESDTNYDLINPVVAKNIDFKRPEDGEVVLRMVQLAKERNIDYTPTHESCQQLHAYCLRKGIPPPEGVGGPDGPVPQYVPQPAPMDFAAIDQPPAAGGMPPQMPPGAPGAGMGGGAPPMMPPGGGAPPAYNPQQHMMPQQPQMPAPQQMPPQMPPAQLAPGYNPQPPAQAPAYAPDPNTMPQPQVPQNMMDPQNQTPQMPPPANGPAPGGQEESFEERLRRLKDM